jgi:hypothetical protein
LRISAPTLNPIAKKCEKIERSFIQCRPFSRQQKLLKCSPLEKLDSVLAACFKQVHESNASADGIYLKEKGLHVSAHLEIANFSGSNGLIKDLRTDITLLTEIYQVRAGVLIQKLKKTGKITDYCKKLKFMTSVT